MTRRGVAWVALWATYLGLVALLLALAGCGLPVTYYPRQDLRQCWVDQNGVILCPNGRF